MIDKDICSSFQTPVFVTIDSIDKSVVTMRLILVTLAAVSGAVADVLSGLPSVPFSPTANASLHVSTLTKIIVDSKYAQSRDTEGETLIPPSLEDFAKTFGEDLATFDWDLLVKTGTVQEPNSIFLTLGNNDEYINDAGQKTSEGYTFNVKTNGIVISGASPLGVWWGTRTIIQQLLLGTGSIPVGNGVDRPSWATRGLMVGWAVRVNSGASSSADLLPSLTLDVTTIHQNFSLRCVRSCRSLNRTPFMFT